MAARVSSAPTTDPSRPSRAPTTPTTEQGGPCRVPKSKITDADRLFGFLKRKSLIQTGHPGILIRHSPTQATGSSRTLRVSDAPVTDPSHWFEPNASRRVEFLVRHSPTQEGRVKFLMSHLPTHARRGEFLMRQSPNQAAPAMLLVRKSLTQTGRVRAKCAKRTGQKFRCANRRPKDAGPTS